MVPVRFVRRNGLRHFLYVCWTDKAHPCLNGWPYHEVRETLGDTALDARQTTVFDDRIPPKDQSEGWPTAICERCGQAPYSEEIKVTRYRVCEDLFDTPERLAQPGDMYWVTHDSDWCPGHWSNCDGKHLFVILPNGWDWDVDSRASNCTMRDETTHRCWVRHGDPDNGIIHVDKAGHTCRAGAGSIDAKMYKGNPAWHGFLHNNRLSLQG